MTTLRGRDIICISSIDWDFIWQGHQELMAGLAAQGNRVLYVENTGVRAPRLGDLPRLRQRALNWYRGTRGFRRERENLFVYSPLVLPFPYSRVAGWINRVLLGRGLERWTRAVGFGRPILWTYLPTRLVVDLIDRVDPALVVYYCVADFEQLAPRGAGIATSERRLLDRADLVLVQGDTLRARCEPHPNVHLLPPGVNAAIFGPGPTAPELAGLPRPIIGYTGGLHRHVDFPLLERVAREVPGTLVLVGPVQADVGGLRALPNVRFVGAQPHERLPEFVRGFDVALVPYVRSEYTDTVYPTKLNEYLAAGVPVVATRLPEIQLFNTEHGDVIAVADDADAFVEAVRKTAEDPRRQDAPRRMEVARQNSWQSRIERASRLMAERLAWRETSPRSWEAALQRLYRRARRRLFGGAAAVAAVWVVLFYTPFVWVVAEPLRVAAAPRAADAIVVLGGGVGESRQAGGGHEERVAHAAALYHAGYAPRIVISSGFIFRLREPEVMRALAVSLGVPAGAIILEERAANTYENAVNVGQLLGQRGWSSILLVSSPYHMRRATATFDRSAPGIRVTPTPVPMSQFYAHEGGATLTQIGGIVHEYQALVYYWWRGWL